MSIPMKNREKKVLSFPKPPAEPETSTLIIQIGRERFAIHLEIEDLPPAAPLVMLQRRSKKATLTIVK